MTSPAGTSSSAKHLEIPEISITTSTSNLNAEFELQPTSQLQNTADDSLNPPLSPPSVFIEGESPMTPRGATLHARALSEPKADPRLLSPLLPPILRPSTSPPPSPPSDQGSMAISPRSPSPSDQGSFVTPPSPSPSDQGSILTIPPSPTLSSHSSVHFQPTTISLRDNQPGSGLTSLKMLSPEAAHHHRRRASRGSHNSSVDESAEETELDSSQHLPLTPIGSHSRADSASMNTSASPTTTAVGTMSVHDLDFRRNSKSQRNSTDTSAGNDLREGKGKESVKVNGIQPISEENMDPSPFNFNPSQLASLVDPKNLNLLAELGGVNGLIKGLGTNLHEGLSLSSLGQLPDLKADHVVDDGGGRDGKAGASYPQDKSTSKDPFKGTLEDRKHVYGTNILPARRSKPLLLLMWLAFKDKVLVCIVIVLTTFAEV